MNNTEPNEAQKVEMARIKSYFPFRIVYGAINVSTGEWICGAVSTMREPKKLARNGWAVWFV